MEKEILKELLKDCKNWRERIIVRIFTKTFIRMYKSGVKKGFNLSV